MTDSLSLNGVFPGMMLGVSGARGIVGEGLNPPVAARLSAAFATVMDSGDIIIARDSRSSGCSLIHAVAGGVCSAGCDALDAGILTTPGAQVLVEEAGVAGGIMVTASHNPPEWNGLKFIGPDGSFLNLVNVNEVYRIASEPGDDPVPWHAWKQMRHLTGGMAIHLRKIIDSGLIDLDSIRRKRYSVVVDTNRGAAGPLFRRIGNLMDLDMVIIGEEPTGNFIHEAEPIPDHLSLLSQAVKENRADLGLAVDPDGDRLVFCLPDGTVLPEEATLPLAADAILTRIEGAIVTNLSTSSMIETVGKRHGVTVHRTAVGEAHVVSAMREYSAVFGGEGNGGVIVPRVHYGRDAVVGLAVLLTYLSASGKTLTEAWDSIPRRFMYKAKIERGEKSLDVIFQSLVNSIDHDEVDRTDGLYLKTNDDWIHIRPSNTEPVLRIVAEASNRETQREIIRHIYHILGTSPK